jgi:hypothetical protein
VGAVSSDVLAERLRILDQVDVARLLERVVLEITERVTFGDRDIAERRLHSWEKALGDSLGAVASVIADLKGGRGYGVASAAFARRQQWRKNTLHLLRFAITAGSSRDYDRWKWVAAAYLDDVASFATAHRQSRENTKLVKQLSARLPSSSVKPYRVLSSCVSERRHAVDDSRDVTPALAAHSLTRIAEVADEVEQYARNRAARLSERDEAERTARERIGALTPAATARARSVEEQIATYRQIVSEADRADRLRRAAVETDALADTLVAALGAYANEDSREQSPILARLTRQMTHSGGDGANGPF